MVFNMKEISSAQNAQFKYLKSLCKSKGLKAADHFLLSGEKIVLEFINDEYWVNKIDLVVISRAKPIDSLPTLIQKLIQNLNSSQILALESELFEELDELGTGFPILAIEQPKLEKWPVNLNENQITSAKDQGSFERSLILFSPLGDPQNLGAVARTAYAFGVKALVLLQESAHPFLPKTIKASSGAILKIPLFLGPSIHNLQEEYLMALDMNGESIVSFVQSELKLKTLPNKQSLSTVKLLLGEEGPGIPENFQGRRLSIPMKNPMESLNVAVAAGIALHSLLN